MNSRLIRDSKKYYKTIVLHRVVWENHHNARLLDHAAVHHIDGNIWNNDPSNLQAMMKKEHREMSYQGYAKQKKLEISKRRCAECKSSRTSSNWYKHLNNTWLCNMCYNRLRRVKSHTIFK